MPALALHTATAICSGLVLALLFGDPWRFQVGSRTVEYGSVVLPVIGLLVLAAAYVWRARAPISASLERVNQGVWGSGEERSLRIALALLVGIGFVLRIARVHEYGLTSDESQFVWFGACETLAELWAYETARSPHPPMMFLMMHYMIEVSWEVLWLRLPSVLAGTYLIWISYRLARELDGPLAGLAMAWLVTFSPTILHMSRVARNYAPGFALLVLAFFLLARFLRGGRWRDFAGYAGVSLFAATWHYIFVLPFIAANLVIVAVLLRRRRPFSSWLRIGLYQLPFAAVMGFLYIRHISQLPEGLVSFHENIYRGMLAPSPFDFATPLAALSGILMPGPFGNALFVMACLGSIVLLLKGRRLALLVYVIPLVVAFGFSLAGRVPLGGTRHSAYLFPFLFGLAAAHVPELATGYRATARGFRDWRLRVLPASASNRDRARPYLGLGPALSAATGLAVAATCLVEFTTPVPASTMLSPSKYGQDFLHNYRQADVDRSYELLAEHAGPNDLVLLGNANVFSFFTNQRLRPVLYPSRQQRALRDLRWIDGGSPRRLTLNGVHYYYTSKISFLYSDKDLLAGLNDVVTKFELQDPERVWGLGGGKQPRVIAGFRRRFPTLQLSDEFEKASNGRLFSIPSTTLKHAGLIVRLSDPEVAKRLARKHLAARKAAADPETSQDSRGLEPKESPDAE